MYIFAAKEDTVKPNRAVHKVWASYRVVKVFSKISSMLL